MAMRFVVKVGDVLIAVAFIVVVSLFVLSIANKQSTPENPMNETTSESQVSDEPEQVVNEKLMTAYAELAEEYADQNVAIMMIDPNNPDNDFELNADKVYTAASTYKLYVAYSMLLSVEKGESSWSLLLNDTTLATCFDRMIVQSDNYCPEAWLDRHLYSVTTAEARDVGAVSTCLGCTGGMKTTARDLANFLVKIYNGEILSSSSRDRLIDTMKRQVYRDGIPAGVGDDGIVADKVGFLDGLRHDAAIVYSDRGDYILVIMTGGNRWSVIADIAEKIHTAL